MKNQIYSMYQIYYHFIIFVKNFKLKYVGVKYSEATRSFSEKN